MQRALKLGKVLKPIQYVAKYSLLGGAAGATNMSTILGVIATRVVVLLGMNYPVKMQSYFAIFVVFTTLFWLVLESGGVDYHLRAPRTGRQWLLANIGLVIVLSFAIGMHYVGPSLVDVDSEAILPWNRR